MGEQGLTRAVERRGRAQARLFIRYGHPNANPHDNEDLFGELWFVLTTCDPESAAYAKSRKGKPEPPNSRRMVMTGETPTANRSA